MLAEFPAQRRLLDQANQGFGKSVRRTGWDEQRVVAVNRNLADGSHIARHHGQPAGNGLADNMREAVPPRREGEDVGIAIEVKKGR